MEKGVLQQSERNKVLISRIAHVAGSLKGIAGRCLLGGAPKDIVAGSRSQREDTYQVGEQRGMDRTGGGARM